MKDAQRLYGASVKASLNWKGQAATTRRIAEAEHKLQDRKAERTTETRDIHDLETHGTGNNSRPLWLCRSAATKWP